MYYFVGIHVSHDDHCNQERFWPFCVQYSCSNKVDNQINVTFKGHFYFPFLGMGGCNIAPSFTGQWGIIDISINIFNMNLFMHSYDFRLNSYEYSSASQIVLIISL